MRIHATLHRAYAGAALALASALALSGCAGTKAPVEPEAGGPYWSYSRVVETDREMLSLFDPDDLRHHAHDPADWFEHDFAYLDDLAAGRFVALLTGTNGRLRVRVTDAPLSDAEAEAAGASATLRLRVRQDRLLLSGGDAWPSAEGLRPVGLHDERWLAVPNGDYRVTATVLNARGKSLHDYVFRLEPIESIDAIEHAPGLPQLVAGERRPAVAGIGATGLSFNERCAEVPREAELSPLVGKALPLPGVWGNVEVSRALHQRGRALQDAGERADLPLVIAREPRVGSIGVYLQPARWLPVGKDRWGRDRFEARGRIACAVRITAIDTREAGFVLGIEPRPSAFDRLPQGLATELVERFDTYLRVVSDPAFRFKSAAVRRAPDYRSLVFGVMQHVGLAPADAETLLELDNEERARRLIRHMQAVGI